MRQPKVLEVLLHSRHLTSSAVLVALLATTHAAERFVEHESVCIEYHQQVKGVMRSLLMIKKLKRENFAGSTRK